MLFGAHQAQPDVLFAPSSLGCSPPRPGSPPPALVGVRGARRKHEGQDGRNNRWRFQKKNFPEGEAGNGTNSVASIDAINESATVGNEIRSVTCTTSARFARTASSILGKESKRLRICSVQHQCRPRHAVREVTLKVRRGRLVVPAPSRLPGRARSMFSKSGKERFEPVATPILARWPCTP